MASKGAIKAASIIAGGSERIKTDYGTKTQHGLAELIDDATAAADLLAACKAMWTWVEGERRKHHAAGEDSEAAYMGQIADKARSAIDKAEGKYPQPRNRSRKHGGKGQ